jgi:hypothetical protein
MCNIILSRLSPYVEEIIGDHSVGFDVRDELQITFLVLVKYWRKNGSTMTQYVYQLLQTWRILII